MKKLVVAAVVAAAVIGAGWLALLREEVPSNSEVEPRPEHVVAESQPASSATSRSEELHRSELPLHPTSPLAGVRVRLVWKSTGNPAVGLRGVLRERSRPLPQLFEREFETDSAGSFACADLLPGDIEVLTDRSSSRFVLAPGENSERQLEIAAGLEVTVRVIDLEKQPIPGAEIWCSSGYHWAEGFVAGRTDARGIFVLQDFVPRRSLAARAAGYEPAVTSRLEGAPGERATEEIVLQRGGGSVRGMVRLPHGAPAERALVRIATNMSRQPDPVGGGFHPPPPATYVRTDAAGMFHANGLPSSLLIVSARSAEGGIASRQVIVKVGETAVVDLQVSEATGVPGRVRSREGSGLPGVHVLARWGELGAFSETEATTEHDGRFVLLATPLGEVSLQTRLGPSSSSHKAVVTPGMAQLDLVLALPDPAERIVGKVLAEDGSPCVNWCVRSLPRPGRMFQSRTDAEGNFAFDECPEPTTTLQIGGPMTYAFVPVLTLEGVARGRSDLRVVVPKDRAVFGTLALQVLGPDRGGLARVLVRAVAMNDERILDRHTGADGRVEHPMLPKGRYRVSLRAPGFGVVSLGVREIEDARGLDLGAIVLAPAVTVRARLEGPGLDGGKAHAGIYSKDGEFIAPQSPRSTATELVFENVPPGEYVAPIGGHGIAVRRIPVVVGTALEQVVVWRVEKGQRVTLRAAGCKLLAECEFTVHDAQGALVLTHRNRCIDGDGTLQVGVSLAAGAYNVRAQELGGPSAEAKLAVPAISDRSLVVDLALR